ncbi:MAG: RHS repeat domain-containing protein [Verrucomicrobiaceae bacterium]
MNERKQADCDDRGLLSARRYALPASGNLGNPILQAFPAYDGNGNIIAWTDENGSIQHRIDYDGFGNKVMEYGAWSAEERVRYGFSTKPEDVESGLLYYGYRYYDPVTGRWPSRDPIEEDGGINLYAFASNNGINRWDYLGLSDEDCASANQNCQDDCRSKHTGPRSLPRRNRCLKECRKKNDECEKGYRSCCGGKFLERGYLCCGGKQFRRTRGKSCCGGKLIQLGPNSGCCGGKSMPRRTKCCVNGEQVNKIPLYERDFKDLGACVGSNTMESEMAIPISGGLLAWGKKVGRVAPVVGMAMLGDQMEAYKRCQELVCPK